MTKPNKAKTVTTGRGGISAAKPALPATQEAPKRTHVPTKPKINAGNIEYTEDSAAGILEKLMAAAEAAPVKEKKAKEKEPKRIFRNIIGEFMPAIKIFRSKNTPLKDIHEKLTEVGLKINFAGFSKALKKYEAAEKAEEAKRALEAVGEGSGETPQETQEAGPGGEAPEQA